MSTVECHGFGKTGHFRRDCTLPEDQQKPWEPKGGGKGTARAAPAPGAFTRALVKGWKTKGAGNSQWKPTPKPLKGLSVVAQALEPTPHTLMMEDGTVLTSYRKMQVNGLQIVKTKMRNGYQLMTNGAWQTILQATRGGPVSASIVVGGLNLVNRQYIATTGIQI